MIELENFMSRQRASYWLYEMLFGKEFARYLCTTANTCIGVWQVQSPQTSLTAYSQHTISSVSDTTELLAKDHLQND